jgi:hypothetical protein
MNGDGVAWSDLGPAEFDKRRMPKGHKSAPADQGGLFFIAVAPVPAMPVTIAPELPGQGDLFGGDDSR